MRRIVTRLSIVCILALALLAILPDRGFRAKNSSEMHRHAGAAVVRVELDGGGYGSGFFIKAPSGKTVLITNAHVCNARGQRLTLRNERTRQVYRGIPKKISYYRDLCAVSVPSHIKPQILPIGEDTPRIGSYVYVLGHPKGGHFVSEQAQMLFIDRHEVAYNANFCSVPGGTLERSFFGEACVRKLNGLTLFGRIFPGNSGGPVVNDRGEVVGVLFAGSQAFAAALLKEDLNQFIKNL